jgi:hypothetical protein
MKKEDSMKPYDPKKSVWVPNKEDGGYDEGLILDSDGTKANVKVGWETKSFPEADLHQINPPKMERCEDVTNMTYLNDASVLWNLKTRYIAKLIYVSAARLTLYSRPSFMSTIFSPPPDLFWPLLRGDQPLHPLSHLHQHRRQAVHRQEEERGTASPLCRVRRGLPANDERSVK